MSHLAEFSEPDFGARLSGAHAATSGAVSEIGGEIGRRFPSAGRRDKTTRIARLLEAEASTDAAPALIDRALPQWQVRRIAYDDGVRPLALSRECAIR